MRKNYANTNSSLMKFLETTSKHLESAYRNEQEKLAIDIKLVFGNESSDLDSILSSIIYSYFQTQKSDSTLYIPILNMKKSNLRSRFQALYLFKELGYSIDHLNFIDTVDISKLFIIHPQIQIVLVDHNHGFKQIQDNLHKVTEIIDHHEDKTASIYKEGQIKKKNIQKAGSCMTLVYEEIKDMISDNTEKNILAFFIATIQYDSFNFDKAENNTRWVQKDLDVWKQCVNQVNQSTILPNFRDKEGQFLPDLLFQKINGLNFSEEENFKLSLKELLFKDYKVFNYSKQVVGYPVLFVSFNALLKFYGVKSVEESLNQLLNEEKVGLLALMFKKEMVLYSSNMEKIKDIASYLLQEKKLQFDPTQTDLPNALHFIDKRNVYTRKVIEPLVAEYFK